MLNKNKWLSICIATYNRSELLKRLYDSIISENCKGIEMIIVNDGSTDETEKMIINWIDEKKVDINYYSQINKGRSSALRKTILNAKGKYSIIMDDDDYFIKGALKRIKKSIIKSERSKYKNNKLAGICFLCLSENGEVILDNFPNNHHISNFYKLRNLENINGDKKEIVKSFILKENIFPYFMNEKRVVTSTLWNKVSYNYNCLCFNDAIVVKRYIKGGMSDSLLSLKAKSPNYQIEDSIVAINFPRKYSTIKTFKFSAILWKYRIFGGRFNLNRIIRNRLPIVILSLPFGFILYVFDYIKLMSSNKLTE